MTDAFAELIVPVLQEVVELRAGLPHGENLPPASVKRRLKKLLDDARRRAADSPELAADFDLAHYGLVYWIDEILITSPWPHAAAWKNAILELDYYPPPRQGGRDFWVKADAAKARALRALHAVRGGRPEGIDPLETFFLCAALGFRGERVVDEEGLQSWVEEVYPLVCANQSHAEEYNAGIPPIRWGLDALPGERLVLWVSSLVAVTALLTLFVFILAVHSRSY